MADSNGIAGVHPVKAAWKEMWGIQGEAFSLCELYGLDNLPPEAWSYLAQGTLQRFTDVVDRLQRAYSDDGLSPLTSYETDDGGDGDGGMGAVAPMGTEVVDGGLISSRK